MMNGICRGMQGVGVELIARHSSLGDASRASSRRTRRPSPEAGAAPHETKKAVPFRASLGTGLGFLGSLFRLESAEAFDGLNPLLLREGFGDPIHCVRLRPTVGM
jgi:hypothetical protein